MSIASGIAAAKASLEVVKLLSDRLNRPDIDVADVRAKVHEMLIHMVNAQIALGEAQVEIGDLKRQLDDRERLKEFGKSFTFAEGVYWYRDYPYCPNCWDVDGKPIRLTGPYGLTNSDWDCPIHRARFYLKKYRQDPNL
jgi:hypothetical protein